MGEVTSNLSDMQYAPGPDRGYQGTIRKQYYKLDNIRVSKLYYVTCYTTFKEAFSFYISDRSY